MKKAVYVTLLFGSFLPAFAQFGGFGRDVSRRATIRGGGGEWGKCTIEVEVDNVAEVAVSGDDGRIRTLAGQPSTWRRFECTSPLPARPADFRFRGIDGRGRVNLVQDPRGNRGIAVVRIEDDKGGREGYTFDLEWRGGDYGPGGGFGRDDRRRDRDRDYDFDRDGRGGLGRDRGPRATVYGTQEAIRDCESAVADRLNREGARDVRFRRINIDNNPGRNDYVIGLVTTRRGEFDFSCSVDFSNGRLRDVDLRRR